MSLLAIERGEGKRRGEIDAHRHASTPWRREKKSGRRRALSNSQERERKRGNGTRPMDSTQRPD